MKTKKALVLWFTGLSGSGKTTISYQVKEKLELEGFNVLILDGDLIRSTITKKLSFSEKDIKLNNLTVAKLVDREQCNFDVIIVPIISPYRYHRKLVRKLIKDNFNEVYIKCSLDECISRDVKGLYKKAINGEINNMIGLAKSNPYEPPKKAELVIDTKNLSLKDSALLLINFINQRFIVST